MSLISLDSIITVNKKYYPQTLLQECIYKLINKKVLITNIDLDSISESENKSNNELDYE